MPSVEGVRISELPQATTADGSDVLAGVQYGTTKRFPLSVLIAWIKSHIGLTAADVGAVATSAVGAAGGVAGLDSNGKVPGTQLDLSGKQDTITASGILKGDGAGGVSAATAGTDYGTYSKPSGGIPASDLASGVIPTVPSAYTSNPEMDGTASPGSSGAWAKGDHVHPSDTSRVPVYGLGKNLLDNAYFVGGGSQLGDGVFPINQRGQTSYSLSSGVYTLDRWRAHKYSGNAAITLKADCMEFSGENTAFSQKVKVGVSDLLGKTVTLSAIVDGTLYSQTATMPTTFNQSSNIINITATGFSISLVSRPAPAGWTNAYYVSLGTVSTTVKKVTAVMLEFGTEQTLAHQENGVLVLNEIPDFGEELRKCQRYLCVLNANGATYGAVGSGVAYSATTVECLSFLPLQMVPASNPSFSFTGSWQISDGIQGGQALPVTSISVNLTAYYSGNTLVLAATVSGATAGKFYVLRAANDSSARIVISAEP